MSSSQINLLLRSLLRSKHCHWCHSTVPFRVQKARPEMCRVQPANRNCVSNLSKPKPDVMQATRMSWKIDLFWRVSVGNTFPLYAVSFLKLPPVYFEDFVLRFLNVPGVTLCTASSSQVWSRDCPNTIGRGCHAGTTGWVVVNGWPSTKTHWKTPKCCSLRGEKGRGDHLVTNHFLVQMFLFSVFHTKNRRLFYTCWGHSGTSAGVRAWAKHDLCVSWCLRRGGKDGSGSTVLSLSWSITVCCPFSLLLLLLWYCIPLLMIFCDDQQPQCTYPEVWRLVTFEASPFPQSKHPVGYNSRWLHRGRDGNTANAGEIFVFFSGKVTNKDDFHTLIDSFKTSSSLWSITSLSFSWA